MIRRMSFMKLSFIKPKPRNGCFTSAGSGTIFRPKPVPVSPNSKDTGNIIMRSFLNNWNRVFYRNLAKKSASGIADCECWNCQNPFTELVFSCVKCGCVIDPKYLTKIDYFEILEQQKSFDLDTIQLSQKFKNLQRYLHPDKFATKSVIEQEYSEHVSALVNRAYQTLLKPIDRAAYLLKINGRPLEEGSVQMETSFLMEIMEINETLSTCKHSSEVVDIKEVNDNYLKTFYEQLSAHFKTRDFDSALNCLGKLKYFINIDEKIQEIVSK